MTITLTPVYIPIAITIGIIVALCVFPVRDAPVNSRAFSVDAHGLAWTVAGLFGIMLVWLVYLAWKAYW